MGLEVVSRLTATGASHSFSHPKYPTQVSHTSFCICQLGLITYVECMQILVVLANMSIRYLMSLRVSSCWLFRGTVPLHRKILSVELHDGISSIQSLVVYETPMVEQRAYCCSVALSPRQTLLLGSHGKSRSVAFPTGLCVGHAQTRVANILSTLF
mgnify:CR=1 FL=1